MTTCGTHGTPTYPGHTQRARRHCSGCDNLMPYWHELVALDSLCDNGAHDLRVDADGVRAWTTRTTPDDGEPFAHTIYVELRDENGRWLDLGYYDGDNPVRDLPGLNAHAFRGELKRTHTMNTDTPTRRRENTVAQAQTSRHDIYGHTAAGATQTTGRGNKIVVDGFTFKNIRRSYRELRRAGVSPDTARRALWYAAWPVSLHGASCEFVSYNQTRNAR